MYLNNKFPLIFKLWALITYEMANDFRNPSPEYIKPIFQWRFLTTDL